MINWLNMNQGFIMSVLTGVYVLTTIIIMFYSRKTIKEMQNSREEESRPYIFAYLHKDPRDSAFSLIVKNFGKTGGKIESFDIAPNLKFLKKIMPDDFMSGVVLAPNQMIHFLIGERADETYNRNYKINISYSTLTKKNSEYKDSYELLLDYASEMSYAENKKSNYNNSENALNNIASQLDSIRHNLRV